MLTTAYLSLGSNLGDRIANLHEALQHIAARAGDIQCVSSFYETEPMEFTEQPWFLNCAVQLQTSHSAEDLLDTLLDIEKQMGRYRTQPKGPRTIDIDLLLFGADVVEKPGLTVPHPAMHLRRFVLEPLAEIAPDATHSLLRRSIAELRKALSPNTGEVRRILPYPGFTRSNDPND